MRQVRGRLPGPASEVRDKRGHAGARGHKDERRALVRGRTEAQGKPHAETDQRVDPDAFAPYKDGRCQAYVLVGGRKQFFPERRLETITYSIEATYAGLYRQLRGYLGRPGDRLGSRGDASSPGAWHLL